jgi:hypothetical protein
MAGFTEADWDTLIRQGQRGRLLPLVGDRFFWDQAGGYDDLIHAWADEMKYPGVQTDRAQLAHYLQIGASDPMAAREEYLDALKGFLLYRAEAGEAISQAALAEVEDRRHEMTVSELAREIGLEALIGDGLEAYRTLARLPVPIYITTGYHNFLEQALMEAGREPRSELCHWRDDMHLEPASRSPADYSPDRPLVFHLFGLDSAPESLVFSEEDHLHFLTRLGLDPDIAPPVVRQAMTLSSLLLLGYNMAEWEFRVVYRGLILGQSRRGRQPNVATQLTPAAAKESDSERVKKFIEGYLESGSFSVYWGSDQELLSELRQRQGS